MSGTYRQFNEAATRILKNKRTQKMAIPAISTAILAVALTMAAGGPTLEIPIIIREIGFVTFTYSFLCCITSMCVYLNLRNEATPTTTTWKLTPRGVGWVLAGVTCVVWSYAVLTYGYCCSSYGRVWISVTVVGLVGFAFVTCVVYVMTLDLYAAMAFNMAAAMALVEAVVGLFDAASSSSSSSRVASPNPYQRM